MSTPVDMTPRNTRKNAVDPSDTDLQSKIQDMISLQYETQRYQQDAPVAIPPTMGRLGSEVPLLPNAAHDTAAKAAYNGNTDTDMAQIRPVRAPCEPTTHAATSYSSLYNFDEEPGVGKGTLLTQNLDNFDAQKQRPNSPKPPLPVKEDGDDRHSNTTPLLISATSSQSPTALPVEKQTSEDSNSSGSIPSYGAISSEESPPQLQDAFDTRKLSTSSPTQPQLPMRSISTMQNMETVLPAAHPFDDQTSLLTPDFQYTNPNYYTAPTDSLDRALQGLDPDAVGMDYHDRRRSSFCACLLDPISRAVYWLWSSENLHRLFCTSAIDGLLTGSGLLAALAGLQLIDASTSTMVRTWVSGLTVTLCLAEAICIGLGHVWNTHTEASVLADERTMARLKLARRKADAKGSLVDVLLQRGMLKIDAMSLADTLEGYPDLFVAAMTGESWTTPLDVSPAPSLAQLHTIASYGRLSERSSSNGEHDGVVESVRKARFEGVFITVGFVLLAMVPSVMFWMLPPQEPTNTSHTGALFQYAKSASTSHDSESSSALRASAGNSGTTSPVTIVILLECLVMWLLGVWKSRFYQSDQDDHGWSFLYSLEPVLILLVCIVVSTSVGLILGILVLPSHLTLQLEGSEL